MTAVPTTMTAIEIKEFGGPDNLVPATRPVPEPQNDEVLIKVEAAGVNRPDVLQRMGGYAPPPGASDIPGLEVAGTVVKAGSGVQKFKVGDRVCALVAGGGYAEYCVAPWAQCLSVPDGYDMIKPLPCQRPILPFGPMCLTAVAFRAGKLSLCMAVPAALEQQLFSSPGHRCACLYHCLHR
nr:alcohol dehydrogenase catalytic domain-containing protein [Sneathiella glossodoripedis]